MTDRDAILREIAKKKVRYELPGMDGVPVSRNIKYHHDLLMDIYAPSRPREDRAPVVVIAMGYPDPQSNVLSYGPFTSWARLFALSNADAAVAYLRAHARALGLDEHRIGVFSASRNVPLALSMLIRDPPIGCAALLCGYTLDLDGSSIVADAAAQFGFANACAGHTVDDLPSNTPLLFVRAGHDQCPGLNDALDAVVRRAVTRNLPLTLVNHASGAHGFDCDEESEDARDIIRQVLAFLLFHLNA